MKLIILFFFLLLNISHFVAADTSLDISARDPEANADVDTIKLGGPSPYQGQSCNCLRIRAEAAAARLEKRASYGLTFSNLINPATWGINGGPANRPQPAGKYGDCSTALGYCWCEWFPSSMCEYCFKEDGGNSSSTVSSTAIQSSVWTTETIGGTIFVTTIPTSLVPSTTPPLTTTTASSTLGITTTVIKGISHAAAPNLGGVAAAGLAGVAAAFAGVL